MTFMDLVLSGKARLEEIDNYANQWHGDLTINGELYEFLGLTWEEYARWAENSDALEEIIEERKR